MTESEWLNCTDPEKSLLFLKRTESERKFRLVACACCRRIWQSLDLWSRNVIDVSENHIDGTASELAMRFAADLHEDVVATAVPYTARHIAAGIANSIIRGAAWPLAWNTVSEVRRAIRASVPHADTYQESKGQSCLIRDIFGNPFRPVSVGPSWLTQSVNRLARAAYDERLFPSGELAPERLAVLSDALEEAGCDDSAILGHLRSPGPHVRGCWAVDLLLGRS